MESCPSGTPEERGWGTAPDAIALVGPLVIVGLHERLETPLQGRPTGEVAAAKGHAPVFLQDRALEPFDKPVRPGMPRLGPCVTETEGAAGLIERPFELGAAVGEHAARPPAGPAVEGQDDPTQEVGGGFGRVRRQEPGHAVRARGIAGRDLPDLAHALELPDVEGVQAHQLARLAGGDMPRPAVLGVPEGPARAFGQQSGRLQGAVLEDGQPCQRPPKQSHPRSPIESQCGEVTGLLGVG
jgi:hypothetical protein